MFKTILVAMDGSTRSEHACAKTIRNLEMHDAKVHALYVVSPDRHLSIISELGNKGMDSSHEVRQSFLKKEEKEIVNKIEEISREYNFEIKMHTRVGDPSTEIINTAKELNADLIVVGSKGKSLGERLLLGSVSTYVVTHSPISTLVVRE